MNSATPLQDTLAKPLADFRRLALFASSPLTFCVSFTDHEGRTVPIYNGTVVVGELQLSLASGTARTLGAMMGLLDPWFLNGENAVEIVGNGDFASDPSLPVTTWYRGSILRIEGGTIRVISGAGTWNTSGEATFNTTDDGFDLPPDVDPRPTANTPDVLTAGDVFKFGRILS